jgi:hypothetical protein
MLYTIYALSLEELSFYFEKAFIKVSTTANLINKPQIFLVFHGVLKASNVLGPFLWPSTSY